MRTGVPGPRLHPLEFHVDMVQDKLGCLFNKRKLGQRHKMSRLEKQVEDLRDIWKVWYWKRLEKTRWTSPRRLVLQLQDRPSHMYMCEGHMYVCEGLSNVSRPELKHFWPQIHEDEEEGRHWDRSDFLWPTWVSPKSCMREWPPCRGKEE